MDMLIALAPDTEVSGRLQKWNVHGGVPDDMFRLRTLEPAHWGLYGYLVREMHEHASMNTPGYPNWSKMSARLTGSTMTGI